MVFQRIWNFAKRHRKKVIASAVITGAYCAWRILLPKLQDALLQRLLGGSEGLNELLELAARGEEGERKGGSKLDFEHKQQVSDAHVRRKLSVLRARHNACFAVEECTRRLQEAKASNTGKAEAFLDFQVECLSKAASAVYTLHVVLLLHRVEFNIAGRELSAKSTIAGEDVDASGSTEGAASAGPEEDAGVYAAFLDSMDHAGEEGVKRIADAVRRAVRSCMEGAEVQPQSATTAESLERLLLDACRQADKEILAESGGATLLPESLDQALLERHGLAAEPAKEASRLLDEARDYLESPQFTAVFQAAVRGAVKRLAGSLEQLADGSSCPLAKLNGNLVALSNAVLDEEGGEDHIAGFADEASVGEFCEMLFFPEQDAATSPR